MIDKLPNKIIVKHNKDCYKLIEEQRAFDKAIELFYLLQTNNLKVCPKILRLQIKDKPGYARYMISGYKTIREEAEQRLLEKLNTSRLYNLIFK